MKCYSHPEKNADFQCTGCTLLLCTECVKKFPVGDSFTYFCPGCNSLCEKTNNSNSKATVKETSNPNTIVSEIEKKGSKKAPQKIDIKNAVSLLSEEIIEEAIKSESHGLEVMTTQKIDLSSLDPGKMMKKNDVPDFTPITKTNEQKNTSNEKKEIKKKEISCPTLNIISIFRIFIIKPETVFKEAVTELSNYTGLRIKFIVAVIILTSCSIYLKASCFPFLFSALDIALQLTIFTLTVTLGIRMLKKGGSFFYLGLYILGIYSVILLIQNLFLIPFNFNSQEIVIIGCFIFFIKLCIFGTAINKSFGFNWPTCNLLFIAGITAGSFVQVLLY